eukprot:CAMPEP_0115190572 /NCGR_PEP_ID=MMETSP0270-20121206/12093_1 /TAXON_ID=71861 /ORGANISM="Scrippsiella trochoidea, Strain CCMP3099" /LENGTH=414 /DNA_ID=CAMNT_0002603785 /DNA_START=1 /DNA_END=1242 /DNA_ORIENTATION=-
MHLSPGGAVASGSDGGSGVHPDMWDPYELLERAWFFLAGLREEGVHDNFRFFVVVDLRAARHLPRWLFDSRAASYFDGQTGGHLRPWLEHAAWDMQAMIGESRLAKVTAAVGHMQSTVNESEKVSRRGGLLAGGQPSKHAGSASGEMSGSWRRVRSSVQLLGVNTTEANIGAHFRQSTVKYENRPQPPSESIILSNPVLEQLMKPAMLRATWLRLLSQLALAVLSAAEQSVVGSLSILAQTPVLGRVDGRIADEVLHASLTKLISAHGPDAPQSLRLTDIWEVLAVLILRQSGKEDERYVAPPAIYALLQNLQGYWFCKQKLIAAVPESGAGSGPASGKDQGGTSGDAHVRTSPSQPPDGNGSHRGSIGGKEGGKHRFGRVATGGASGGGGGVGGDTVTADGGEAADGGGGSRD